MPSWLRHLSNLFQSNKAIEMHHRTASTVSPFNMVWFQHFHKAGGTSVIEAARIAGYQFFEPNINGNPMSDPHTPIPLWDWSKAELSEWLVDKNRNGVDFVCAEFGFSHEIFEITKPCLKRVASIRRPKDRLISNFIYDVAEGYTKATTILDYMQPNKTHTMPDYYTRLVTQDTGDQARKYAVEAIKRFDYVSVLEEPQTFSILQSHLPGLTSQHANRTNYEDEAVQAAWATVREFDAELEALCVDETKLYDAVCAKFRN